MRSKLAKPFSKFFGPSPPIFHSWKLVRKAFGEGSGGLFGDPICWDIGVPALGVRWFSAGFWLGVDLGWVSGWWVV